ncbi:MAG: GNAT family N-acetyltransferase [Planctomycetota bacterium]
MSIEVGPPGGREDVSALAAILAVSFGATEEGFRGWLEAAGIADVRVARRGGVPAGGLLLVPMGQFFGGRSVPMTGVAGVGVAPEHRGAGVASRLMAEVLEELHGRGVALSALYASTQTLYRKVGYELAGVSLQFRASAASLPSFPRDAAVRPITAAEQPRVRELYTAFAARSPGHLDRREYIWRRVEEPDGVPARGWLAEPDGYLYLTQQRRERGGHDLLVGDLVALSPESGRRLLSLLSDFRSLAKAVTWRGGPASALPLLFPEETVRTRVRHPWMLRVVDVSAALEARGYPHGVETELHLAVRDDFLPANSRKWVLSVSKGTAGVRPGGRGRLHVDIRGLAPLYTGYLAPEQVRAGGLLDGPDADLRAAAAVFSGPLPSMPDHF